MMKWMTFYMAVIGIVLSIVCKMQKRKHKKDTKANTHWDRWERSKGSLGRFKHCDWNVDGRLHKSKIRGSLVVGDIHKYKETGNV